MANEVIIEGVEEVQQNLNDVLTRKIPSVVVQVMRAVTKTIEENAKLNCPVDTGALQASLEGTVTKTAYPEIEGVIGAGKPEYMRGVGSFKISQKTQKAVFPEPTIAYADFVENKTDFMKKVYAGSSAIFKRTLVKYLKEYLT
jgi:hypothetical protein